MATRTNRSRAGFLVCLSDPVSDRHALARRCVEASCCAVDQVEDLPQWELGTVYPGRIPRFAYFVRQRQESIEQPASSKELVTATKTPVVRRSIEEGVK